MAYSLTPQLIMAAARDRNWQTREINAKYGFYSLTHPDGREFYIRNITCYKSSSIHGVIFKQKDLTHQLLLELGVQVPATMTYEAMPSAVDFMKQHGTIVVKPVDQSHGDGISIDVQDEARLKVAIEHATSLSKTVLLQQQVAGDDYRLLFIDKKMVAAMVRQPAYVVGDGTHTVNELIDIENARADRGVGYQHALSVIDKVAAIRHLGPAIDLVVASGQEVQVVGTANTGSGGVAIDVTDTIDQKLVDMGQAIVDHFDVGLCGVDILYDGTNPYVIEINSSPSLRGHEFPYKGKARHPQEAYLDWLEKP